MATTILIVDRDPLTMKRLDGRLRYLGYQPLAADPLEAENLARKNELDVILLQGGSLKGEALRLLSALKKICPETPVILLNGGRDIALSIKSMKLGAFDDLIAPFDVSSLDLRIQAALAQSRKGRWRKNGSQTLPEAIKRFALAVGLKGARIWYGETTSLNGGFA